MNRKGCLVFMNLLYYAAFIALVAMLILPHTTIFYRFSIFEPFATRVNTKTIYLTVGERYQINLFDVNKRSSYYSSDFKVADVNSVGVITAYRAGKSVISIRRGNTVNKYRVYVVKLNKTKIKVKVSSIKKLRVKGKVFGVTWKSSDKSIATVNRFGWVKGRKKGTAIITATIKGKKLKCKVYVK